MSARPHRHPRHRHPGEQRAARLLVQLARARVVGREALALARAERVELGAHASSGSGLTAAIFSARRCCQTVRIIIATVNRKIIDAIT